jgi:hypothetical protein
LEILFPFFGVIFYQNVLIKCNQCLTICLCDSVDFSELNKQNVVVCITVGGKQSDTEPDLTLDEIFAFSKRLKKYTIVKDDNFLGVAQDSNSKSETAILQRCLK